MTITDDRLAERVNPYHYLGNSVEGITDLGDMLAAGGADFDVSMLPLTVTTPDGVSEVLGYKGLTRLDTNEVLAVHKDSYTPVQYRDVMQYAFDAVALRPSDNVMETLGTMYGGRQFFATVNLGTLVLDPGGIADAIDKYLAVFSSHDGTLGITLAETNIRVICTNQATSIKGDARNKITAKHTRNVEGRLKVAKAALGIADRAAAIFEEQAMALLAIPANTDTVVRVANKIWPLKDDASDKGVTQHTNRLNRLVEIFESDTCEQAVGSNGWAAYNAFTQYLDHGRGTDVEKRALATVKPDGWVERSKVKAGALLLN